MKWSESFNYIVNQVNFNIKGINFYVDDCRSLFNLVFVMNYTINEYLELSFWSDKYKFK